MNRDEIAHRLTELGYGENIIEAFQAICADEMPKFSFALREDIKDDKKFLPTRATPGSAGWDVSCAFEDHRAQLFVPGEYIKIPLGIRCIAPKGWWLEMKPRSSTFTKKNLSALYGTIDQDFRGMLCFCAKMDGHDKLILEFGEKIGQIVPVKLREMEVVEISNEEFDKYCEQETNLRGAGGFGSTSK